MQQDKPGVEIAFNIGFVGRIGNKKNKNNSGLAETLRSSAVRRLSIETAKTPSL